MNKTRVDRLLLKKISAVITGEETPDPEAYYLTPEQVESEIEWIQAGGEPRIDWWRLRDTITHKISEMHTTENHGDIWWQMCGRCQERLYR